jgi:Arc/MetJ-type ribon-helix-helix transcriptional regulator
MGESREIRLPADLCAAAEEQFGGRFRSVDELVVFLLQELIRRDTADLDRADQAEVEERLRALGYL